MASENKNIGGKEYELNFGRLFLGIIILMIGLFYLGRSMGFIPEGYNINISQLWPILIIYFGLSMIQSRGWLGTLIGIIGTIIVLIIVLVSLFIGNIFTMTASTEYNNIPISIEKEGGAQSADISIKSGAGRIIIAGGAGKLIEGNLKTNFLDIKQNSSLKEGVQSASVEIISKDRIWLQGIGRYANDMNMKLNSEIPLTVSLDSGASSVNADFSNVMLKQADIKTGMSSMEMTLGDKLNDSAITINAGMSSIKIHIPQNVGVKLFVSEGLSSKKLSKFITVDEKNFISENYGSSDKKIYIEADMGMSGLEIDWL